MNNSFKALPESVGNDLMARHLKMINRYRDRLSASGLKVDAGKLHDRPFNISQSKNPLIGLANDMYLGNGGEVMARMPIQRL